MTLRKTKIVATLGPSSSSEEMLARMITAGVNVVRLNFSHGLAADHIQRAETVRAIATKLNRPIGILCDLQGPKIRIGKFALGKVSLKTGDLFTGDEARRLIGLAEGVNCRIKPVHLTEFDIFVQSTSVNRKLIGGSLFLYEVED